MVVGRGVSCLPSGPVGGRLDEEIALLGEEEGGGDVTAGPGVARAAGAGVVLPAFRQDGHADGLVGAGVAPAAGQHHVAVPSAPRLLVGLGLGAAAGVGVDGVLAPGAVLTWLALALVHVHLAVHAWRRGENKRQRHTSRLTLLSPRRGAAIASSKPPHTSNRSGSPVVPSSTGGPRSGQSNRMS